MKSVKKYLISLGWTMGIILVFTIILSILSYFDLLNNNIIKILKLIIPIISTIIGGFVLGKNSNERGYEKGIKLGIILSLICLFLALIFKMLSFTFIIFALLIISSSMIGAMIGIMQKPKN